MIGNSKLHPGSDTRPRQSGVARPSSVILLLSFLVLFLILAACQGKSKNSPSNVGSGFTLLASGGTLNDGSGEDGLAVLVTLRNEKGDGPGAAAGWKITIKGPGFLTPLVVDYTDGSQGSYCAWWWPRFDPLSGTYTATASNGTTTLTYHFVIDATQTLTQPVLNPMGGVVSWNPVAGAGGYYYEITDGAGGTPFSDYIASDPLLSQYSFTVPTLPGDGSYSISVYALTQDRYAIDQDTSAPKLPSQNNDSVATIDFVQNGTGSGYTLDARGGVLYEGSVYSSETGTEDFYGLVIWASILTTTSSPTPPASDWIITVTGPNIDSNYPVTFTYPKTDSQYIYWDYGTIPVYPGTYTISAFVSGGSGTTTLSQLFTVPSPTAQLPIPSGISATPLSGGGASVTWKSVAGAGSYYVNFWTSVWNAAENKWEYVEVAGSWVPGTATAAAFPSGTFTKGVSYDAYVTACELDMTDMKTVPLPVTPGQQVNMSDPTVLPYVTIVAN